MNTTTLLKNFDDTFNIFLQMLAAFPQERINTVPFEGSWTGAQVARHLLKGSAADLVYGNVKPGERQPDLHEQELRELFLNFDVKFQSPDMIVPEDIYYDKNELISGLESSVTRIRRAIQTLDLTEICLDFEMPTKGFLTRWEWISFYTVHTQRHTRQLQNIFKTVMGQTFA
jgi:hypothetical protein